MKIKEVNDERRMGVCGSDVDVAPQDVPEVLLCTLDTT